MSSRFDNIQSRSIYVGASTNPDPALGNLIIDGSVGIGTNSPSAKIHVSAGDSSYALFGPNVAYGGSLRVGAGPATPSNTIAQVVASDGNLHLDSGTGQLTYINYYSSTNTLINPNSGNVGIGTYSPAVKLDVFRYSRVSEGSDYMQFGQWDGFTNRLEYVNRPFKIVGYSINSDIIFANNSDQERMRITTAGNVGIGTTAPDFNLTINGITGIQSSGTTKYHFAYYTGGLNFAQTGIADYRLFIKDGGYVGIGTGNPQARLDVNGGDGTPAGNQFAAVIKGADSGNRTLYFDGATQASVWWGSGNTPQFAIDSISGGGANFWTNNGTDWSERMRIQSNGDIAINTTVASYKLDVNGWFGALRIYPYNTNSTYFAGDTGGITVNGPGYFYAASSGGSYFEGNVRIRGALSNDTAGYLQINGGTANLTYFAGTIGVGTSYVYHNASITSAGKIFLAHTNNSDIGGTIYGYWDTGYQPYSGGLVFQSFNANGGTPYTMKDAMWLTGNGNLGVATSTPGARLSVIESGSTLAAQFNTINASATNVSIELGSFSTSYPNSGTHIRAYVNHGSTIASSLAFEVNGQNEALRINSDKNVGIGTTTPYTRLDVTESIPYISVSSSMPIESTTDGQAIAGINFRKHYSLAIGASIRQLQAGGTSSYGQAHLAFYTNDVSVGWNDPVERMRITAGGQVAIGTAYTYGNALSVNKGVSGTPSWDNATLELRSDGGLTTALVFHRAGYTASTIYSDDGAIAFGLGGEKMRIANNGNVGIGTSSPAAKLHVVGDVFGGSLFFSNANINSFGSAMTFTVNSSERMRITTSGNIGIGTTAPPGNATNRAVEIVGSDSANLVVTQPGAASAAFTSFGSTAYIGTSSSHPFYLYTNNSERMRVTEAGNVGVGTPAPDPSALLDVASRRQGFLPPRMRYSDMMAIPSPAAGLIVFDTDNSKLTVYTGTGWVPLH